MSEKYVIASFRDDDEFVGYLSAFSPTGMNQFHPQITKAMPFSKREDCIYSDGQTWELGRDGGKGYYKIEKTSRYYTESKLTIKTKEEICKSNDIRINHLFLQAMQEYSDQQLISANEQIEKLKNELTQLDSYYSYECSQVEKLKQTNNEMRNSYAEMFRFLKTLDFIFNEGNSLIEKDGSTHSKIKQLIQNYK